MKALPQTAIDELQTIYQKEFGIKLSEDAAKAEARRLLLFFYEYLLSLQDAGHDRSLSTDLKMLKE